MAFRERIELLVDVTTGNATSSLGKLRTDLSNTDGAFGKLKVGATGAFDLIKQHAATAALAAGTALVGFATKAVADFQEVALGAGQLRDSLGLTAEEASRLQEVGADLGISTSALESTIGRMNRTAAESPDKFDDIGAAIKRNADGTVNVNETFLATVDALNKIPDASTRAAAAQEIFGRSWQDISELVASGADGVREALEGVEDAKVIDDAEIAKARRFRDALDELKGIAESASLVIGESIVPVLTTLADAASAAKGAIDALQSAIPDDAQEAGFDIFSTGGDVIEDFRHNWEVLSDTIRGTGIEASVADTAKSVEGLDAEVTQATGSLTGMDNVVDEATGTIEDATDAVDDAARATENLDRKWSALKGQVSADQAWVDIQDALANVQNAAVESFNAASSGAADAAAKARDHQSAVNALKDRVIEYGRNVAGIPPRQVSEIIALIDEGRLQDAEDRLNRVARARSVQLRAAAVGNIQMFAEGGTVGPGGGIGGEAGPEIVEKGGHRGLLTGPALLSPGTKVTPIDGVGTGGNVVNVTINMPPGSSGRDVVNAIRRYERFNGNGWRAS